MKLSVVIVNYNTRYFIDLCIASVLKSLQPIKGEVIVVDNHSTDNSCQLIKTKYPEVILIENKENTGFGRANNLGISRAKGEYVLILNPDTLVPEDCFEKCVHYLDRHPEKGALGVKMVDGAGRFLPESKRGLPTPQTAFYKMSGLYKLFPKSSKIARYYHGEVPTHQTHDVDVLTGAFFMARKTVGNQVKWFDEVYFMYGEDIDLSYSFTQAGYPIVYFPETSIVHFKGESSKDVDQKYIASFFGAMQIFYNKHFEKQYSRFFHKVVQGGISLKSNIVRITQQINRLRNQKTAIKKRNFVVWASSSKNRQACADLLKIKAINVNSEMELRKILIQFSGDVSLVFTPDLSIKNQLELMEKLSTTYAEMEFFFLSPTHDFILGSNDKNLKGLVWK